MNKVIFLATVCVSGLLSSQAAANCASESTALTFSVNEIDENRFELVAAGREFKSRDEVERELLLRAARLSVAEGAATFVLFAMPGEQPDIHPPRRNVSYGSAYGHWQPHWIYYVPPDGWQPWHPEWGAAFWTSDIDAKLVKKFEAHVIIGLGRSDKPADDVLTFNSVEVLRDLTAKVPLPKN